ncbi:hypothetical protein SAMN03080615_01663 [Amphritea atlantica]|uniref:Uncharacterized protein n=1 Tax=Amphritea atlantica TaxID=355243 RepID=A0A1H9GGA1_9GAMM|nr:hypothetical protein [Amphritea atlantica]SEQ49063.1 hypothetical protein SAMN03080615_01663 [Amphritea atlantica]
MKYLMLVWMWLALHWQWVAGAFVGAVVCRLLVGWLQLHNVWFLVWYAWLWWVLAVLLVLALVMRFVFGGINVQ